MQHYRQVDAQIEPIKKQCLQLTNEQRRHLANALYESLTLDEMEMQYTGRVAELLDVFARVLGVSVIPHTNRKHEFVWARNFVAWQLQEEGFKYVEIIRLMRRDKSTVNYMLNQAYMAFSHPEAYRRELAMWRNFKNELNNEDNDN